VRKDATRPAIRFHRSVVLAAIPYFDVVENVPELARELHGGQPYRVHTGTCMRCRRSPHAVLRTCPPSGAACAPPDIATDRAHPIEVDSSKRVILPSNGIAYRVADRV